MGLLSKLLVTQCAHNFHALGKAGFGLLESTKRGLTSGPEGLMPFGHVYWWSSRARAACQGHARTLKCPWAWCGGPSKRLPAAALPGSSDTHAQHIYIFMHMYANFSAWTELPSFRLLCAVWNVSLCRSQSSHVFCRNPTRAPFRCFQRHSLCWSWERRRFASTRRNQRFSRCLPLHFLRLTHCFSPAQLTYILHYASDGGEYIKIQEILYTLPTFFITAIDVMY